MRIAGRGGMCCVEVWTGTFLSSYIFTTLQLSQLVLSSRYSRSSATRAGSTGSRGVCLLELVMYAGTTHCLKSVEYCQNVPRPVAAMSIERAEGQRDESHSHKRSQLLYGSTGIMTVVTAAGAYVLPPQRALWLPHGVEHEVYYSAPVSLRTLYVEPEAHGGLPGECRVLEVSDLLRSLIFAAVDLPAEYDCNGRGGWLVSLLLEEIAVMPATRLYAPLPKDERLARFCRKFLMDLSPGNHLQDIVGEFGMCRRTATRLFRRETGMTFREWRQHVRLLHALSRLAGGSSISTVAYDIGYASPSAFCAMFRRTFGVSPSTYLGNSGRTTN